jgi:hypothetical protein
MNIKAALTAMAALMLVAGCGSDSAETANGANSAAAAPANASAASAAGTPVTQDALVGTWGQGGCTNTMTFAADGTATSSSAQQANNRWSLDGSTIVIASPGEEDVRMPATMVDGALHITGGGGEGASMVMTRCGTEEGGATEAGNEAAEEAAE